MAAAISVSLDGAELEPSEARISVLDDGLLRGDGAFEAIKLYGAHPFRLDEHLSRLQRSAAAIDLEFDLAALRDEVGALIASAPEPESMLRIVVTRGGRRLLIIEELPEWPPSAHIALVELSPSEILAGVKSISYAANMQATRIAAGRGADEAVFVDRDGVVLEAPTSSIFWTGDDGRLRTPALSCGILDSITRQVVVDALDVIEGSFQRADLLATAEAFLASTTREIQPISAIDRTELPADGAGEATAAAASALAASVEAERNGG
jgi:branched-chain amino acid aminotransferase